ncbi:hypothetical protein [Paracidovorax valerianellae]|nr:hypothetical protein [Paracidovorax valerianellae]MDA8446107.1 hypothetical protein [Paracidovorax valerianellae]
MATHPTTPDKADLPVEPDVPAPPPEQADEPPHVLRVMSAASAAARGFA